MSLSIVSTGAVSRVRVVCVCLFVLGGGGSGWGGGGGAEGGGGWGGGGGGGGGVGGGGGGADYSGTIHFFKRVRGSGVVDLCSLFMDGLLYTSDAAAE